MAGKVLVIDDEQMFREDLARLLETEGFVALTASSGELGVEMAEKEGPDVVLCDLMLPGMDGVQVVDRLSVSCPEASAIVMTAFGTMESAVRAFRKGAIDFILKPVQAEDLLRRVHRCVGEQRLRSEVRYLRRRLNDYQGATRLVGESPAIRHLIALIDRVAPASSPVLLCGETGTGKELAARILHERGLDAKAPFVAVNCASISGELFGSELFGHVKGSFTGAVRDRLGHFQVADGGTLFLDELGELPLEMQPKLLRALDSGEILPVGASKPVHVQVRLVAATNRDLREEIAAGRFRDDLYYRLSVIEMQLPPLRERSEDIPPLSEHLLQRIARRLGRRALSVRRETMGALMKAPWPGNVRELENVLERAAILADGEHVEVGDLPEEISGNVGARVVGDDLRSVMRDSERRHINRVLADTSGNREEAARRLGIDPSTLYRHLRAHDEQE